MITARKTNRVARALSDPTRYPVYEGPAPDPRDERVQLEDGTICHVHREAGAGTAVSILCTELVAMAGDNVVRRRPAAEGPAAGLGGPSLYVCPAEGAVLGYYRVV